MFGNHIGWVVLAINEVHSANVVCDGLAYTMKRQHGVVLMEFGVGMHGRIYNRFVVTKNVTLTMDWDTKVAQSMA